MRSYRLTIFSHSNIPCCFKFLSLWAFFFLWQKSLSPPICLLNFYLSFTVDRAFSVTSSGIGSSACPIELIPPSSVLLLFEHTPVSAMMAQCWHYLFIYLENNFLNSIYVLRDIKFSNLHIWLLEKSIDCKYEITCYTFHDSLIKKYRYMTRDCPVNYGLCLLVA